MLNEVVVVMIGFGSASLETLAVGGSLKFVHIYVYSVEGVWNVFPSIIIHDFSSAHSIQMCFLCHFLQQTELCALNAALRHN